MTPLVAFITDTLTARMIFGLLAVEGIGSRLDSIDKYESLLMKETNTAEAESKWSNDQTIFEHLVNILLTNV
jgi:hypothetical protein